MKVYVVSECEYDDSQVTAVFSTKEAAKEYIAYVRRAFRGEPFVEPEEFELDAPPHREQKQFFAATVKLSTGETREGWKWHDGWRTGPFWFWANDDYVNPPDLAVGPELYTGAGYHKEIGNDVVLFSAESQEHANKLAIEFRQKVLRMELEGMIRPVGRRKARWQIKAIPKMENADAHQ